ncbi:MAG: 2-hydroxyacyl-CoA dehydratase family protein [Thermodesulfobacteriota bacterium]|nr:2-hydroxyacyl-CoA dehydratase family protein [Thermodesulfobacteriota bacterium]
MDFYTELMDEMNQRVKDKISAVPRERYRLLWDNLPIWHKLKWLSEKFSSHNACLVADTYTSAWCSSMKYLDETRFLDSMADGYAQIYLNLGIDQMAEEIVNMVKFYRADGVVMHSNRSCKPYSFGQMDIMPQRLPVGLNVPDRQPIGALKRMFHINVHAFALTGTTKHESC